MKLVLVTSLRQAYRTAYTQGTRCFLAGEMFSAEAKSESLVRRYRKLIGGRDKANNLPLTPHAQNRLVSRLRVRSSPV